MSCSSPLSAVLRSTPSLPSLVITCIVVNMPFPQPCEYFQKESLAMKSIRVVLADDQDMIRAYLIDVLELEGDITVTAAVGNAADAIDAVVDHGPDVVILDINMPGLDCFHAAEEIRRINAGTRIIILSGDYDDRYIESALRVEAWGYVTKADEEAGQHLINAIREISKGRRYFSPKVQERMSDDRFGSPASCIDQLTEREAATLTYLARGYSKKEIAGFLHISVKTIEKHTQSIMDKLDIHDRVKLALWYAKNMPDGGQL